MTTLNILKKKLPAAALFLTVITVLSGCVSNSTKDNKSKDTAVSQSQTAQNNTITTTKNIASENIAVVVTLKNELLMVSLNENSKNKVLDSGGVFSRPLISPDRSYVTYIKDNGLYVSSVESPKIKIADSVPKYLNPYVWLDKQTLLYSPTLGGLYTFDVICQQSKPYLQNEYNYQNIILDTNNNIYAEKYRYYKKDGSDLREDLGIIAYNPSSKEEKTIIKPIPNKIDSGGGLGMYPVIAGTSVDNRYLFFFKHPYSGSIAADGVELAVYDTTSGKLLDYGNKAPFTLTYKDNISPNPKDSTSLALINGGGREMSKDKALVLFNVLTGEMQRLTPEGTAAMTPNHSSNGKSIIYASSPEQKLKIGGTPGQWLSTGEHHIYAIDTTSKQITQVTNNPTGFDFGPKYIGDNTIIFFRRDNSNNISLWKIEKDKETMLADKLTFSEDVNYPADNYYGYFDYTKFSDIK